MQVNGMLSPFASPLPTLTELGGGGERDRTDDLPACRAGCSLPSACPLPTLTELGGGGERDRTDDLLRAKQVLSQLSYTPINCQF